MLLCPGLEKEVCVCPLNCTIPSIMYYVFYLHTVVLCGQAEQAGTSGCSEENLES